MNLPIQTLSLFSLTVNKHYIISDPSTRRSLVFWLKVAWFPFCQNDSVRLFVFSWSVLNQIAPHIKTSKSKNQVWDEKLGLLRKSGCHTHSANTHAHTQTYTQDHYQIHGPANSCKSSVTRLNCSSGQAVNSYARPQRHANRRHDMEPHPLSLLPWRHTAA